MTPHMLRGDPSSDPQSILDALRAAPARPGMLTEEVPSPSRMAPQSLALTTEVLADDPTADPLASGRWVALHDPEAPEEWGGPWRIVTYTTARVESELAHDPWVGDVGQQWLRESLAQQNCHVTALSGTTTRATSEAFGDREHVGLEVVLEIRASWTPLENDLVRHLEAWRDLLATCAGVPHLPDGVVPLQAVR